MKKVISMFIISAMVLGTISMVSSSDIEFKLSGDVNDNGMVDAMDALEIMKYLHGIPSFFDEGHPLHEHAWSIVTQLSECPLCAALVIWGYLNGSVDMPAFLGETKDGFPRACTCEFCEFCGNPWNVHESSNNPGMFVFCTCYGRVLAQPTITIMDALEILKYLAGIPSAIESNGEINPYARNAALIVDRPAGTPNRMPTIMDALEILKHLAGIPSALD